jgi:hypothetical protein
MKTDTVVQRRHMILIYPASLQPLPEPRCTLQPQEMIGWRVAVAPMMRR